MTASSLAENKVDQQLRSDESGKRGRLGNSGVTSELSDSRAARVHACV